MNDGLANPCSETVCLRTAMLAGYEGLLGVGLSNTLKMRRIPAVAAINSRYRLKRSRDLAMIYGTCSPEQTRGT